MTLPARPSRAPLAAALIGLLALTALGCSGAAGDDPSSEARGDEAEGEIVRPPFAVRGELEGLMLTYFDDDGIHLVERRSLVPEAARAEVRIDSPSLAPDERDADRIYVADLRAPGDDGAYVVRQTSRARFEARALAAREAAASAAVASGEVIIFGASWCGACHEAAAYLRQRGVPFIERDIETEPGARSDMLARARAAGITPNGIPIIDVRGRVFQGFDPRAIERALAETGGVPAAPPSGSPTGSPDGPATSPAPSPATSPAERGSETI